MIYNDIYTYDWTSQWLKYPQAAPSLSLALPRAWRPVPGLLANASRLDQLFGQQKLQLAAELQQLRAEAQELRQRQREMAELELEDGHGGHGAPWGAMV